MLPIVRTIASACLFSSPFMLAQQPARQPTSASDAPGRDTSYIDANGTAHITRVIPVPQDLSPEARKFISQVVPDEAPSRVTRHATQPHGRMGSPFECGVE
jgi:hypothetical protein